MSFKWVTLSDLGYVHRGRSKHRPRNAPELYGGPYPFVQTADIKHAALYLTEYEQTYSQIGLEQSRLWPVGTLCITIAANIADTAILGCEACFPDSVIGFIPDKGKCDVRYVKYLFDTELQVAFQQLSQGVAQDNLSKDKLLSVKFQIPDLPTQRRIADILSAYDDLIENNRRRIAILEETARLAYCKWFGDTTARTAMLGELCHDVRRGVSPDSIAPSTPYIGLEHMPRRSISLCEWDSAQKVTSTKLAFDAGDILFGKIRPYFHKVGIAFVDGVASSDAIVIKPNRPELLAYVLMTVSSDAFVAAASQGMKEGSKMPRADWKQMLQYPATIPDAATLATFNKVLDPILVQLKTLCFSIRNLASARDMLLPRLMKEDVVL